MLPTWSLAVVLIASSFCQAKQYPFGLSNSASPAKLPFKFVALGDSFAAGPGAGNRVSWWDLFNTCRRSDHSYPALLDGDERLDPKLRHTFDFRACTGARIEDVLKEEDGGIKGSQLDYATKQANITTLSIGGNDVGFFDILDSCIFHFGGWGTRDVCFEALANTWTIITGTELDDALDLVIKGVINNTTPVDSPQLFITGYSQFFNAESTQCNNATFCIWENPAKNHTCPRLSHELRRTLNSMIKALNVKVGLAAERAALDHPHARIQFVDYDQTFEGHRFCEPHNVEPDYSNPDIWFYQTWGDSGEGRKHDDDIDEPSYDEVDPDTCLPEAERSGDWGRLAVCQMARAKKENSDLMPEPHHDCAETQDWGAWITPNQLARIFHPKIGGHQMIAEYILSIMNSTST